MTEPEAPLLRIVTPDATPEEVAALVAVFAALGQSGDAPARAPRPAWNRPDRGVRRTDRDGAGGWRASGLPH